MKQSIAFLLSLCLTPARADNYIVSTPHTSLVVTADKGKGLRMELQPSQMSKEDFNFAKRGIAAYKQIRDVVQMGDLYRLHAPYEGDGVTSLMYVSVALELVAE